ncbi:serine/threonine-protein kinase [Paenibacillus sp. FSL H8-0332]|uniref:serine/threonine-protein kinase n=1 Tax=Paenibacillus sp. FSL H8-0332 TaxID=2954742 RepID=UPI0030D09989
MQLFNLGDLIDNRYEVLSIIGAGGMGAVLKVLDNQNNEEVALKYCKTSDEDSLKRFKREVRIMSDIDHYHVVSVENSNLEYDPPYFTMPIAEKSIFEEIPQLIHNHERALDFFEQICNGVQAIHLSMCTHRDINPKNALILENELVVVSDLGLAKFIYRDSTVLTHKSTILGTDYYAAPEQSQNSGSQNADVRTDIFQLGKTLYHMLTGDLPSLIDPNKLPAGLSYIIQKSTKNNPADRYQSVGHLIDAINVYRLSLTPYQNPIDTMDSLVEIANEKLKANTYDQDNVTKMMEIVYSVNEDDDLFIKLFDKIPERLLMILAEVNFIGDFLQLIELYSDKIKRTISEYGYSYAETVARKMHIVLNHTSSPEIKRHVYLSVLCAAVKLNRYAAMEVFDDFIKNIKLPEEAIVMSEVLSENMELYKSIYGRVPKGLIHPAIKVIWELCDQR